MSVTGKRTIKENNGNPFKKKGFTLIELMVSIALLVLILTMVYSFFSASHKFFGVTDRRADAQTQLSMIMEGLKRDVSTSKHVEISDISRIPNDNEEELYYAGISTTNDYTLLHEVIGNTTVAYSNLPLKGFQITYEYNSSKPKILKVAMTTSEGYTLSGEILSPNVNITGDTSGVKLVLKQAQ